jgi:methyl-accepting chemotaxis protein
MLNVQKAHPAYVEVFAGSETGAFVSSLEDSSMPAGYDPRKRPWYTDTKPAPDRAVLGKAYLSTTGEAVTSAARCILRKGRLVGVIGIDISLKKLTELIKSVKLGDTGYLVLVQDDGVILAESRHEGYNFKKTGEVDQMYLAEMFAMNDGNRDVTIDGKDYLGLVLTSSKSTWKLMGFIEKAEINAPVVKTLYLLCGVGLLSLVALALAVWFISTYSILRPLAAVSDFVRRIAGGDYARRIEHARDDEIGEIYEALNATAETLAQNMRDIEIKTREAEEKARVMTEAEVNELARQAQHLDALIGELREEAGRG